jgi:uncharacterized protein (DUF952 family)
VGLIYHITTHAAWEAAQAEGELAAPSLTAEGFIHCSRAHQLLSVAKRFFLGQTGLLVLAIDEAGVAAILVNEAPTHAQDPFTMDQFPHLYGKIPVAAVVGWTELPPDPSVGFRWPAQLPRDATH